MAKTRNMKELATSMQKYWQKRSENDYLAGEKDALQVAKELKANYEACIKEIENDINRFYVKYATNNQISLQEANKLLSNKELKSFKKQLKELLKADKGNTKEFKRLYTKTRITRLEELKANILNELNNLTLNNETKVQNLLETTYEDNYYKTIYNAQQFKGFSSSFSSINPIMIETAIKTKYINGNYSTRLWQNESNLITILNQEIPRGLTLGYNPRKLAKQVSNKLDTNYNNTVRLIRTEYTKTMNDSTMLGYEESGINKYQVLATLDSRTCDICGIYYDSKIYDIKDAEVGINMPPFHANCRCTTIPYFEPDEFDDLSETVYNNKSQIDLPLDITYNEWKENLHKTKDNKMIYR